MRKILRTLISSAFVLSVLAPESQAYDHGYDHGGYGGDGHDHGWYGHFHDNDIARWHGGFWANRFHDGRNGWWWVVGDQWYYYPAPVYPYPDPYVPPMVVARPGMGPYWYCANPAGFYPYVPQCFTSWQPTASYNAAPVAMAPAPIAAPVSSAPMMLPSGDRDADDRQLNGFAIELSGIKVTAPDAKAHIVDLQNRVNAFHQALFQRGYNAMDILKDTEGLEKRIAKQKSRIYSAQ